MQVVRAIYDEHGIRAIEPIKVKRQTEVLVIFPNEVEKPFEEETRDRKISEDVKKLVENGQIAEAREVLSTLQPGTSTVLDNWQRALAYPRAKLNKAAGGENIKEDAIWLQNNSDKYKGKWIALKNGILHGAHESRIELRRSLKQAGKLVGTMFFRIDN